MVELSTKAKLALKLWEIYYKSVEWETMKSYLEAFKEFCELFDKILHEAFIASEL